MVRTEPVRENLANLKLSFGASPGPVAVRVRLTRGRDLSTDLDVVDRRRREKVGQKARAVVVARPRKTHDQPPPPPRIHLGGLAQGEEALPRESAEISDGQVGVAQDAARVAAVAAAVEAASGAVLGQDDAGVSGTLSTRRFPMELRPRRARTRRESLI
jgi:hypothetical protein